METTIVVIAALAAIIVIALIVGRVAESSKEKRDADREALNWPADTTNTTNTTLTGFPAASTRITTPKKRPTASDMVNLTQEKLTRVIPLTQDKQAYLDAVDADRLKQHNWVAHKTGKKFVAARYVTEGGKRRLELMHRNIADQMRPDLHGRRYIVRHKDDDGLNCRRENIDIVG